jgi:uncharacterized membrane protein (UPF0127 family)
VLGLKKKLAFFSELSLLVVLAVIGGGLLAVGGLYVAINSRQSLVQQACAVNSELSTTDIRIDGKVFKAEVAETLTDKAKGLSGRDCLASDRAMLFPYQTAGNYCFWMKDMNFPIDMVWLNADKQILNIASDVRPDTYPQSFCPEGSAQYIVEVNAGIAQVNDWQPGDYFSF